MIRRQLSVFLIVGLSAVAVDFVVYRGALWLAPLATSGAKAAGFIAGTVFAYFANRRWTFPDARAGAANVARFACLYAMTLAINVAVNRAVLVALADDVPGALHAGFIVATGMSAALNFLGMKFFVFRPVSRLEAR